MDKQERHKMQQLLNEYEAEKLVNTTREDNIMDQEPTIGRIVHYVKDDFTDEHRPAIVVKCEGSIVNLQVFTAGAGSHGTMWASSVEHDEELKKANTWHWPERVQSG